MRFFQPAAIGYSLAAFFLGVVIAVEFLRPPGSTLPGSTAPNAIDIGFSQDMSVHHSQALLIASIALGRPGVNNRVRALAAQIELAQAEEIGIFRGWLRLWNAPGISSKPMSWMTGSICAANQLPNSSMPGLATEPELEQLRTAQGPAVNSMFLRLMLRHHNGGISMIRSALAGSAMPQVRVLANEMLFEESEEIGYMKQIARIIDQSRQTEPVSR